MYKGVSERQDKNNSKTTAEVNSTLKWLNIHNNDVQLKTNNIPGIILSDET